jgi:hypothetical protein
MGLFGRKTVAAPHPVQPPSSVQTASTEPVANSGSPSSAIIPLFYSDDASTFVAFRYDDSHVLFRIGDESTDLELEDANIKNLHLLKEPLAEYDKSPVWEPDENLLKAHRELFDRAHTGEQWQLEFSADSRMQVIVQKPVVANAGCFAFGGFLAEVVPASQKDFAASAKQYFLIRKNSDVSPQGVSNKLTPIGPLPEWKMTPEVRSRIEELLKRAIKEELPKVHAEAVPEYERAEGVDETSKAWSKQWKQMDEKLGIAEGKLGYDTQAFQLAPDGMPRLFVRARWMIDGKAAFLLSLWLRAGPDPVVEQVDAREAKVMRMREFIDANYWELANLGTILNVFDRHHDGHGELLIYSPGYEGYDIHLFRYTEAGLVPTNIAHGGGC